MNYGNNKYSMKLTKKILNGGDEMETEVSKI